MKKILCPTDFSDASQTGIAYAAKFAQAYGAYITLFNVQSLVETVPEELILGKPITVENIRSELEKQSREISAMFHIACYYDVQPTLRPLSSVIESKAHEFDLIIMGTGGTEDFYEFFFGLNTYQVIKKSKTPVLFVPEDCWYTPVRLLTYAYDYFHDGKLPLSQLQPWCTDASCELRVVQVMHASYNRADENTLLMLQEQIQSTSQPMNITFGTVWSSETVPGIHQYVLKNKADMLVLCTHQRGFLENLFHKSVIKDFSEIARYPVLVIHE
jgi:nucleotide-binding universal stress UspA family protein